jgi:hypothetical protein
MCCQVAEYDRQRLSGISGPVPARLAVGRRGTRTAIASRVVGLGPDETDDTDDGRDKDGLA